MHRVTADTHIGVHHHALARFKSRFLDRVPDGADDNAICEHIRSLCREGLMRGLGMRDAGDGGIRIKINGVPMIVRPGKSRSGSWVVITILPQDIHKTARQDTKRAGHRPHVLGARHARKKIIDEMESEDAWT